MDDAENTGWHGQRVDSRATGNAGHDLSLQLDPQAQCARHLGYSFFNLKPLTFVISSADTCLTVCEKVQWWPSRSTAM
jgi:hypothetical protein